MATDTRIATATDNGAAVLERVITAGDLSRLQPAERVAYYRAVCDSVGLNPLTKPFDYLSLNGKLVLYATKTATDQLRSIKGISIDRAERDTSDPEYATWLVTGHDAAGRVDTEIGSVSIKGLAGENKANAIMKALTKGKRRLTLSLAGLGWLDESEVSSIPAAQPGAVDVETGELRQAPQQPRSLQASIAERRAAVAPTTSAAPAAAPVVEQQAAPTPAPEVGAPADGAGDADIVEGVVVEVREAAPVQCDGFSDEMGRCRKAMAHSGPHRNPEGTWPQ